MGRILLMWRLAARDLRRRPSEAVLLLLTLTSATTMLTLGLVLTGVVGQPFESTKEATAGPDVMASVAPIDGQAADLARLEALADEPGVTAHSGPFPYSQSALSADGVDAVAWAQGRDTAPAAVDQPVLTSGGWVRDGGAVIEASFAEALSAETGDTITLDGRNFEVLGVAVTANTPPYPKSCFAPCYFEGDEKLNQLPPPVRGKDAPPTEAFLAGPSGLVWLTDADARSLVTTPDHLGYVMNLVLDDPAGVEAFTRSHQPNAHTEPFVQNWQEVLSGHTWVVEKKQETMQAGSILLGLLALASAAVLVGGRMAEQFRRVGLLKAVGATPRIVAAVLLAEHLVLALIASAAGLTIGRATAPLFTDPGSGLIGSPGTPPFSLATVGLVTAAALAIATLSTVGPALRAARTSTLLALLDSARPPRRTAWLNNLSARLPVPLLLGLRVASRRPRRTLLGVLAITVTTSGIVTALAAYANRYLEEKAAGDDPRLAIGQALTLVTVMLIVQACVNAICITRATVLDTRRSAALARAMGATPRQISAGFAMAQALPALIGVLFGVAGGIGLAEVLDDDPVTVPPLWQLLTVITATVLVVATLTAVPVRINARRAVGEILNSESR